MTPIPRKRAKLVLVVDPRAFEWADQNRNAQSYHFTEEHGETFVKESVRAFLGKAADDKTVSLTFRVSSEGDVIAEPSAKSDTLKISHLEGPQLERSADPDEVEDSGDLGVGLT